MAPAVPSCGAPGTTPCVSCHIAYELAWQLAGQVNCMAAAPAAEFCDAPVQTSFQYGHGGKVLWSIDGFPAQLLLRISRLHLSVPSAGAVLCDLQQNRLLTAGHCNDLYKASEQSVEELWLSI